MANKLLPACDMSDCTLVAITLRKVQAKLGLQSKKTTFIQQPN